MMEILTPKIILRNEFTGTCYNLIFVIMRCILKFMAKHISVSKGVVKT